MLVIARQANCCDKLNLKLKITNLSNETISAKRLKMMVNFPMIVWETIYRCGATVAYVTFAFKPDKTGKSIIMI